MHILDRYKLDNHKCQWYISDLTELMETREFQGFEAKLSRLGCRLEAYLQGVGSGRKHLMEVLLRVPIIFIMHQLILLSPTSDNVVIEIPLFIFRYIGMYFDCLN